MFITFFLFLTCMAFFEILRFKFSFFTGWNVLSLSHARCLLATPNKPQTTLALKHVHFENKVQFKFIFSCWESNGLKDSRDHKLKTFLSFFCLWKFLVSCYHWRNCKNKHTRFWWLDTFFSWDRFHPKRRHIQKLDRKKENRLFEIYYICNTCFSTVKMP